MQLIGTGFAAFLGGIAASGQHEFPMQRANSAVLRFYREGAAVEGAVGDESCGGSDYGGGVR